MTKYPIHVIGCLPKYRKYGIYFRITQFNEFCFLEINDDDLHVK